MSELPPKKDQEDVGTKKQKVDEYFERLKKYDDAKLKFEAAVLYESELKTFREFLEDKGRDVYSKDAIAEYLEVDGKGAQFIDDHVALVSMFDDLGVVAEDSYNRDKESWFEGNDEILFHILLEAKNSNRSKEVMDMIRSLYARLIVLELRVEAAYRYSRGDKNIIQRIRDKCIAYFVYAFRNNGYKVPAEFRYLLTNEVEDALKEVDEDQERIKQEIIRISEEEADKLEAELDEKTLSSDPRFSKEYAFNAREVELDKIDELEKARSEADKKFCDAVINFVKEESDPRRIIDVVIGDPFNHLVYRSKIELKSDTDN